MHYEEWQLESSERGCGEQMDAWVECMASHTIDCSDPENPDNGTNECRPLFEAYLDCGPGR